MRDNFKKVFYLLTVAIMGMVFAAPAFAGGGTEAPFGGPNNPGIVDPRDGTRILHTDQATDGEPNNVSNLEYLDAKGSPSLRDGCTIKDVKSPNDDMEKALQALAKAAEKEDDMTGAAQWLMNILEGTTCGAVYDGFAMLNYNNDGGEYKTKTLTRAGTEKRLDGAGNPTDVDVSVWETDVSLLFYDGQIDSDTFLVRVPADAEKDDTFKIHYTIYSAGAREEFAPTVVMAEAFPFKGFDSVWVPFGGGEIMKMTLALPPLRMARGVYTWGWRVHPPRIQFLQPIFEMPFINNDYGRMARDLVPGPTLEPQGLSFAHRNAGLTLEGIGDAAPEKKMWHAAQAGLAGNHDLVDSMLNEEGSAPTLGTWDEWADLAKNMRQLPPEALDAVGGNFGDSRMVSAYVNNEMYGDGPAGPGIPGWNQGDKFNVKVVNLDNHTHYFRNVDFGPRLHDDIADCCQAGSHSFEIMNFKPTYGAPKVAEMQWRAGWGFRPHHDANPQPDVFPRASDQKAPGYMSYTNGGGVEHHGYQFSADNRQGDFTFNPPPFIVGGTGVGHEKPKLNGGAGITIGRATEGWGIANMCSNQDILDANGGNPKPPFCPDISSLHPTNAKNFPPFAGFPNPNVPTPPGEAKFPVFNPDPATGKARPFALRFPPFLRNPDQAAGGDIIAPTPLWKPFFWINPQTGDLSDPGNPGPDNFWADKTYSHGTPIRPGDTLTANLEMPRASAQVFYQFDDLFHDNAIFSPHPTFSK